MEEISKYLFVGFGVAILIVFLYGAVKLIWKIPSYLDESAGERNHIRILQLLVTLGIAALLLYLAYVGASGAWSLLNEKDSREGIYESHSRDY